MKARVNLQEKLSNSLEHCYRKLKKHIDDLEKDLDSEIKANRLPDHLQLLVRLFIYTHIQFRRKFAAQSGTDFLLLEQVDISSGFTLATTICGGLVIFLGDALLVSAWRTTNLGLDLIPLKALSLLHNTIW